jgi:carbamoylphosphate synthase large subunit
MFIFHWMFDKLGYMPKIDIQVGKINFEPKIPDLEEPKPRVKRTRALPSKATTAKTTARTARAKKAK